MKIFLLMTFFSKLAIAGVVDGVPMNCIGKAESRMSREVDHSLVAACRDRKNPKQEHYTFCNGSGCTGFTAVFENKKCVLTNWWSGQDDQDQIDPIEWKKDCLVKDDFRKEVPTANTDLNSKKIASEVKGISYSSVYELVGNTDGKKTLEVAEAVGKQIRREYYQQKYSVESHSYRELSFKAVEKSLKHSEGDFVALKNSEISKIERWFEDHSVEAIVEMSLETSYMSGTGLEQNYIFIPTEKYEPVLVIKRFYYAE